MTYQNDSGFRHSSPEILGVLLLNLGTPDAPTEPAVRRFLSQFLRDPRVIELPQVLWWPLLYGVILRMRPRRTAKLYAAVWTDEGAPLLSIARRQTADLQQRLEARFPDQAAVALGMRYGNPSIRAALAELRGKNARRILVLPLYPQYSATTTASAFDAVTAELSTWRWIPELRFINHYHDREAYITALAGSIRSYWSRHEKPNCLLFSFHGIPRDYFLKGDPYYCQCLKTARLTAEALGLTPTRWEVAFQSRVGKQEWLKPYTDETLLEWGRQGVERVHVICPGFSADCLETLEEIAVQGRYIFLGAGGKDYGYIPALNNDTAHMEMIEDLIVSYVTGWGDGAAQTDAQRDHRAARARARGAEF